MGKNSPTRLFAGLAAFRRMRAGLTLALLALAIQCFTIQTHVDVRALGAPAQIETSVSTTPTDSSAPCLICQEMALTGAFLQATPPTLALLAHTLVLRTPAPYLAAARIFPAHAYFSRGPPLFS